MKQRTHLVVGLAASLATGDMAAPAMLGAVIPDIDISWSYRRTRQGYRPRSGLPRWLGHRGITHFALLWIGLFIAAAHVPHEQAALCLTGFAVGGLSHLAADALTPAGIPLLSFQSHFSLHLCKTGSFVENLIAAGLLVWIAWTLTKTPALARQVALLERFL